MADIPWRKEKLQALIEGTRESIKRSRFVFFVINISCILIFAAVFNGQMSWALSVMSRDAEMRANFESAMSFTESGLRVFKGDSNKKDLDKALCEQAFDSDRQKVLLNVLWHDLYFISVPVLGLKLMVSDLSVIGSLAIVVSTTWFWFCLRRENGLIETVVEEGKEAITEKERERALYLYYGVVPSYVFTTLSMDDDPKAHDPNSEGQTQWLPRAVRTMMFYLPLWTLGFILASDAISVVWPFVKVFLYRLAGEVVSFEKPLLSRLSWWSIGELALRTVVVLLALWATWHLLKRGKEFIDDTRKKMLAFHNALANDPDEKILSRIADDVHQPILS